MKSLLLPAWIGALFATTILTTAGVRAQDSGDLATARDLYASAAYDDALAMLNRLRSIDHPVGQQLRTIEQYRAFCLLALGRASDAEQAIAAMIVAEPSFHPSESDASPRVRSAFTTVRRRMLPAIIQQQYAQAKAAFDRKDWAAAADGFHQVVVSLADDDVAAEAKQPPLADLRLLAIGFEELSTRADAPPPPLTAAPPPVADAVAPSIPLPPHVYAAGDGNVLPPVPINQVLPPYPGHVLIPRSGKIEVVIDESGAVESAIMTTSVTTAYDSLALSATKAWRYRPATVEGAPVKFRKVIQITIRKTT